MQNRTVRGVGLLAGTTLLALATIGPVASPALARPATGSIWTTNESCLSPAAQDDNLYAIGETVHVRGAGFEADAALSWAITGLPGGASGDPRSIVASGVGSTDATGGFCLAAYRVAAEDWGQYTVDVVEGASRKNDNYRVDGAVDPVVVAPSTEPSADPPTGPAPDSPPAEPSVDPGEDPAPTVVEAPADPSAEVAAGTTGSDDPSADPATEIDRDPATDPGTDPDDRPTQEVLAATSGPVLTPPPTDTVETPAGAPAASWPLLLAWFGFLTVAAALVLPDRKVRRR